jgi:glyoxylase-like metal-dependent hydrolase (beta-lactamase superfamily II)
MAWWGAALVVLGAGSLVFAAPPAATQPTAEGRRAPERVLVHGDPRVGTYVSSPWGFSTSSYWIEGPSGLVVIDTQFLPSAAEEMLQWAESTTGKKAALAIVLHANPDKFNGTEVFRRHGIRVVTSAEVRALIPGIHEKRVRAFYDRYKPDYPREATLPESFGDKTMDLSAAGITVRAHVLGAGCSEAHVVVEFDEHLFVGDLVANGSHSWLEIGRTDEWLKRIAELRQLDPSYVHPGRGPSGGPKLLDREEAYLRKVMDVVAAEKPLLPVPAGAIDRVRAKVEDAFVGYDFPVFLNIGLPAEWERQARIAAAKRAK